MIRVSVPVFVSLLFVLQANSGDSVFCGPPRMLLENVDYTEQPIAKIYSDDEGVFYSLKGIGADQSPFNVFVIDPRTGYIRVTKVLDREFIGFYHLTSVGRFSDGTIADEIVLDFKVVDENDNAPVFGEIKPGKVDELSPTDTLIMKVMATDADEPWSIYSQIAYTIIDQKPPDDMFHMNRDGAIYVKKPFLDREKCDQYLLTVRGQDLNGAPGGNSGTGTVTINVGDVNDNLPTLEKEQYEGSIEENTQDVEVMRIKAEDLDLNGTDNWEAVFDIVRGNEAGYFSIKTDPDTNEGILMLDKPVDYEDVKNLELGLTVRNKAPPFHASETAVTGIRFGGGRNQNDGRPGSGGSSWQSGTPVKIYPIKISVKNQPEGPYFDPKVKTITISEGETSFNIKDVIASYPAIDDDTGELAKNVTYAKGSDPDNWLTIDPETAEIKLNKTPDKESPYVVNGKYFAKVLCISEDMPRKTATGTIAIQVEDFNVHCPILTSDIQTMCTTQDAVIVNANDEDVYPNGAPLEFEIIPQGTKGRWQVEHLNGTAAILWAQESMWPGIYQVELVVKDQQGKACPELQKLRVRVCTCEDGVVCRKQIGNNQPIKGARLGPADIGILVLGLVLLLLFVLLLLIFCQCRRAAGHFAPTNAVRFKNPLATATEYVTLTVATETLSSGTVLHSGK